MSAKRLIYDLDFNEIAEWLNGLKEPIFRAEQIWQGLYHHLYTDPEQFSNLPIYLRRKLADEFGNETSNHGFTFCRLEEVVIQRSSDHETEKTLFRLTDGRQIETVLMYYNRRHTVCISTQSGCAMGCVFCATGQMGFGRHLSSGEIVEQVLFYARKLTHEKQQVTNVVVMGMGEPFHNYDSTLSAIDRLNHPKGFNLGARRFTISTVGLVPAIRRFTAENRQVNLAVSLHAADDDLRSSMLPVNRRYPLVEVMDACKEYVQHTHRRITFEWALIEGVNDTPQQAQKLAKILNVLRVGNTILCHVNAIPLNPTRIYQGKAASLQRADIFRNELEGLGIPCTVRVRRGIDIQAGCGQLAGNNEQQ